MRARFGASPRPSVHTFANASSPSASRAVATRALNASGQTTGLDRITTSAVHDYPPTVSPDGKRVAFVSNRGDGNRDIYVMKLAPESAANRPVRLTKHVASDQFPEWSPDGQQIAFSSERSGNPEVYRMKTSPEGRRNRPVNLSKSPSSYDSSPAWSPDGKKIAFTSDRPAPDGSRDFEIWRMRATDGANPVNLTNDPGQDWYPAWQPLP